MNRHGFFRCVTGLVATNAAIKNYDCPPLDTEQIFLYHGEHDPRRTHHKELTRKIGNRIREIREATVLGMKLSNLMETGGQECHKALRWVQEINTFPAVA